MTVLMTIILTMTLGILCGYAAVMGLLRAFGHRPQSAPATATLATSMGGSAVSGD